MKFIINKSKQTLLQQLADQYEEHQITKKQIKSNEFKWGGLDCNLINPDQVHQLNKLEKCTKLALHKLWKSKMNTHFKTPQNKTICYYLTKFSTKCSGAYPEVCDIISPLTNFYMECDALEC